MSQHDQQSPDKPGHAQDSSRFTYDNPWLAEGMMGWPATCETTLQIMSQLIFIATWVGTYPGDPKGLVILHMNDF